MAILGLCISVYLQALKELVDADFANDYKLKQIQLSTFTLLADLFVVKNCY